MNSELLPEVSIFFIMGQNREWGYLTLFEGVVFGGIFSIICYLKETQSQWSFYPATFFKELKKEKNKGRQNLNHS